MEMCFFLGGLAQFELQTPFFFNLSLLALQGVF